VLLGLLAQHGVEIGGEVVQGGGDHVGLVGGDQPVGAGFGQPPPPGTQHPGELLAAAGIAPVEPGVVGDPGRRVPSTLGGGHIISGRQQPGLEGLEPVQVPLHHPQCFGLVGRGHVQRVDLDHPGQRLLDRPGAGQDRMHRRCRPAHPRHPRRPLSR
jgi:hypothetical protein